MQEQHEPVPIHIRIDTQEQRSGIPDLLAAMPQVHVELTPLRMGDYVVGGDPCRIFERKTGSDFLCSLAQGRLFPQLAALLKSRFAPILLLEGDPLDVSHSQMRPESIRGALAYIAAVLRVPILPSSGPTDSAHLVYAVAKRCQVGKGHARVEQAVHGSTGGTTPGDSIRTAVAHPAGPARHRPRHRACCLCALSQFARSVECRRCPTCDGPRCWALASRCTGTAAACCLANLTRCAHIKKRRRRTNAGYLQHTGARTHDNQRRRASSFLLSTEAGRSHFCLFPQAGTYRKEGA